MVGQGVTVFCQTYHPLTFIVFTSVYVMISATVTLGSSSPLGKVDTSTSVKCGYEDLIVL